MDLYWLVEHDETRGRALAVVGVHGKERQFRPLGTPGAEWPPITGYMRLLPVRTKPLTDDLTEALDILEGRVGSAMPLD